eukprot:CAMPEP_0196725816 /NCGR_PEP_ID=MMETSP1091-20130531/7250_1 /TAXON_ID=302021 /ORGANISM="Rhodomonas sp., Strain CCMP768" /LENGTH=314 /DNA_ID=CAMNT_0042068141 /DNA_START=67 /DNA_END=1010 /DNA_ORIENTATION=-
MPGLSSSSSLLSVVAAAAAYEGGCGCGVEAAAGEDAELAAGLDAVLVVHVEVEHQDALHRRPEPLGEPLEGFSGLNAVRYAQKQMLLGGALRDHVRVLQPCPPLWVAVSVERPQPQPVHVHGVLPNNGGEGVAGPRAVAATCDADHDARGVLAHAPVPALIIATDAPAPLPVAGPSSTRQSERPHAELVARNPAQLKLPPLFSTLGVQLTGVAEGLVAGVALDLGALQDVVSIRLKRHPVVAVCVLRADGLGLVGGGEHDGGAAAHVGGHVTPGEHGGGVGGPLQDGLHHLHQHAQRLPVPPRVCCVGVYGGAV